MKKTKEYEVIRCQDCGTEQPYPVMFPVGIYAECWKCCWDRHIRQRHPPTIRDRRNIKRKVRAQLKKDFLKEIQKSKAGTMIREEVIDEQKVEVGW